ncbi:hypothetical protein [Deinococcus maricopensis]|uniref:Uncharacterized protein n=1 Tax=Deinococcus maricopensis (strain DSM 21211 / LMG 22137 / NRRL B-23946 / LB-34) TaxID=709986 RepID=E8U8J5_DEIML|nr:hypothetical protein [Deinococcus maricopensis]ADV67384.1 hypothetical protein Deima_1735 [Deinococcus maricopensis DSM 21211]
MNALPVTWLAMLAVLLLVGAVALLWVNVVFAAVSGVAGVLLTMRCLPELLDADTFDQIA